MSALRFFTRNILVIFCCRINVADNFCYNHTIQHPAMPICSCAVLFDKIFLGVHFSHFVVQIKPVNVEYILDYL